MSLTTRTQKGTPLSIDEMDNNLLYLQRLGLNKEQLKDAYNLAIQEPHFMFNAGSFDDFEPFLHVGAFKTSFLIGSFFLIFDGPLNLHDWNHGPVTSSVDGVFVGSKIETPDGLTLNGFSFPIQNDVPILGNVSIINAPDAIVLISDFIEIHYQYESNGNNYLHEFLVRVGSALFFNAIIEGDDLNLQLTFNDLI